MNAITTLEKVGLKCQPPKPTKKQLLQATALAISEQRKKELEKLNTLIKEAWLKVEDSVKKNVFKNFRYFCYVGNFGLQVNMSSDCLGTQEQLKLYNDYNSLEQRCRNLEKTSHYECVLAELHEQIRKNPDQVVENLLKDEVIKKQLIKAGEKLLATPTPEDKKNSITV